MTEERWRAALARAALPGSCRVEYRRAVGFEDGLQTTNHKLTCLDKHGVVIGDGRDYDLLKAVMTPLESLSDGETENPLLVVLNLLTGGVSFGTK